MEPHSQKASLSYLIANSFGNFSISLISTYLVLFLLESITITQLGILVASRYAVQALFEFPTGTLGDTIGQQRVLIVALVCQAFAILVFIIGDAFNIYLIATTIQAIGNSQESGALLSWYDNKIKKSKISSDDNVYLIFMSKINMIGSLITGTGIVIGGVIASLWSRIALLKVYFFVIIFNLVIVCIFVTEDEISSGKKHKNSFSTQFTNGMKFLNQNHGMMFYYIGVAFLSAAGGGVWYELMLFPYYRGYSGSDFLTSVLRSSMFVGTFFLNIIAVKLSQRIQDMKKHLWSHYFIASPIWFSIIFIYTMVFPATGSFVFATYIGLFFVHLFPAISIALYTALDKNFQMEVIPNEIRNSIYSVGPTLETLFGVVFTFIGAIILDNGGFHIALAFVICICVIGMIFIGVGLKSVVIEFSSATQIMS